MANIPKWAIEKIRVAKAHGQKKLDLSWKYEMPKEEILSEIPMDVFALKQLEVLDIRWGHLNRLPEAITHLTNLTTLYLSHNQLTNLPDSIGKLTNLTTLDVSSNKLINLPDNIGTLTSLTRLDVSGNQLTSLPETIGNLFNLNTLSANRNQLSKLPIVLSYLPRLTTLNLDENYLTTIPETISQLKNLEKISLQRNQLTFTPDALYELSSLKTLNLFSNKITKISSNILHLKHLKKLELQSNPIELPPPEVAFSTGSFSRIKTNLEAIKNYFRQKEAEGIDFLYEAKLLIVGEPGAGKTTLAKKIENPNYQLREDEISTEGIAVIPWEFPLSEGHRGIQSIESIGKKSFRINIWDFGGQEIYHATHQFFLTKRSLYILVADTRKEDTDFYYWLNIVELLSDNSPLLIIKNEKQDRHREINERALRGQFTNLKETLATNFATMRGLSEILDQIRYYISHLPHIGTELPKTWVRVREALDNDVRNYISLDEFLKICDQHGFKRLEDKLQLNGYLHDLGVCLHFQDDPLLRKTVILKPEWGTAAVYKVLDNKDVIRNLGEFTKADLAKIWHEETYTNMQDELLQLMINFKLCYQIPGNPNTYIAPQLLTENQPAYEWGATDNIRLRYTYEFMPKGILTRFIVAMHQAIADQRCVWKSGVIVYKDHTKAEVIEYYGKREISIRVAGKHKKELLTIVIYELDKIHESFNRLKYSKMIPCNCTSCKESMEPHFYAFDVLREFVVNGQQTIQCQRKPYQMVKVLGLIDDVVGRKGLFEETSGRFQDNLRKPIPADLRNKIVGFLTSIPNLQGQDAQQAFLYSAGLDHQLYDQISVGIPLAQFFQLLLPILERYGKLEDGRDPLIAILQAAKGLVGKDRQAECDGLIQDLQGAL